MLLFFFFFLQPLAQIIVRITPDGSVETLEVIVRQYVNVYLDSKECTVKLVSHLLLLLFFRPSLRS